MFTRLPSLRILIAIAAGILCQYYFPQELIFWLIGIVTAVLFWLILFYSKIYTQYHYRWLSGVAPTLLFIFTGAIFLWQKDIRHQPDYFGHFPQADSLDITVTDIPTERNKSWKLTAKVDAVILGNKSYHTTGVLILYVQKKDWSTPISVGDRWRLANHLQRIKNMGNPGGFDYEAYSKRQNLFYTAFTNRKSCRPMPASTQFSFQTFLVQNKLRFLNILRRNISGQRELGLAEALLLGHKADLDEDLNNAYTNTGVVHIIAISGGHLLLIYDLFFWLLGRYSTKKWSHYLFYLFILSVLWTFTLITGASASILRASIMLSIGILGTLLRRTPESINTLLLSGLILLLINPYFLWDVGFWLSFLAVLGILLLYKLILHLCEWQNPILFYLWNIIAVTLSAQVFTLPLVLYCFHQFPVWFLLANIPAILLSSIALTGEVILLFVGFIPILNQLLGKMISFTLWLLDEIILGLDALPVKLIRVNMNFLQMVLLFAVIICILLSLLEKEKYKLWKISILLGLGIIGISIFQNIQEKRRSKFIVYNIPGKSAIDVIQENKTYYWGDTGIIQNTKQFQNYLLPSRMHFHSSWNSQNLHPDRNGITIANNHIYAYDAGLHNKQADVVIVITDSSFDNFIRQKVQATTAKIIFDSSIPLWKIEKWKKEYNGVPLRAHSVALSGAFILE